MKRTLFLSAMVLAAPVVAGAQVRDSGTFVIRLGTDTTAIERFVRTSNSLEAVLVQRSPRTAVRTLRLTTGPNGGPRTLELRTLSAPELDAAARTTMTARFEGDSIRIEESQGERTTRRSVAWRPGAVALVGGFYSPYETLLRRVNRDSAVVPAVLNLAPRTFTVRRTQNGFELVDQFNQPLSLRTDASGRLVAAAGAGLSTAERVGWVDLHALVREFAGRDTRDAGMGVLSPADSVRTTVGGARVHVDYSRPGRRGRPIFGQLVPWNQVWRTGANDATHIWSDRPLRFGNVTVPAGTHTLFSIPSPTGWRLVINKQTGQAGTDYDAAQDLARIPMRTRTLTEPVEHFLIRVDSDGNGGVLRLAWDRTEAFVPFTVLPRAPAGELIETVARALGGVDAVRSARTLVLQGVGENFSLGQNLRPDAPLPRYEVTEYRRVIDLPEARWRQEQTRVPRFTAGNTAPQRQVSGVDGEIAFNVAANGTATRVSSEIAAARSRERWQHPIAIVQLALAPFSTVSNLREVGAERLVTVSSTDGTRFTLALNRANLPTRVSFMMDQTNLGDVASAVEFSDYRTSGGVQLPHRLISKVDRFTVADLRLSRHEANTDAGDLAAPTEARNVAAPAAPPVTITVDELAPGVWLLAGQSHHSVVVEFRDHLVLIEAPQNDARTLAVIQRARELRPGKPLARVINTHHHFDHSGGVRAAVAEGLALQTHPGNVAFFRDVLARPHTILPDALARRPNRTPRVLGITDGTVHNDGVGTIRFLHLANAHSQTMLALYLPQHRLVVQADLYSPPPANAPANLTFPFAASLVDAVRRANLQVDRVAGIHGGVVTWDELVTAAARR